VSSLQHINYTELADEQFMARIVLNTSVLLLEWLRDGKGGREYSFYEKRCRRGENRKPSRNIATLNESGGVIKCDDMLLYKRCLEVSSMSKCARYIWGESMMMLRSAGMGELLGVSMNIGSRVVS